MNISFTICSANYLPYAKSLGDSLITHNVNHQFIIILLDNYPSIDETFFSPHHIIHVNDMHLFDFAEMEKKYTIFELSCAIKPYAADFIFKKEKDCDKLFYFDADILIFNSLATAEDELINNSILLTPHLISQTAFEGRTEIEKNLLRAGIYNAGFFALKKSKETNDFLDWWKLKMKDFCYNNLSIGLFVDQLWLNLAPAIFRGIKLIYDDGYNVAYWNLDERILSIQNQKYVVNENAALVFFHFSGYDINVDQVLSKHLPQQTFDKWPVCVTLFYKYKEEAQNNNINNLFSFIPQLGKKLEPSAPIKVREKNFFKRKYKKWFLKP